MEYPKNQLVPLFKRIEVYKSSLDILNDDRMKYHYSGLCIMLPCILWNLNSHLDSVNGEEWDWMETKNMFPEIEPFIESICILETIDERITKRISIIEKILLTLNESK